MERMDTDYLTAVGQLTIATAKVAAGLREIGYGLGVEVDRALGNPLEQVRRAVTGDLPPWREEWVTAAVIADWLDTAAAATAESQRIVRAVCDRIPPREFIPPHDEFGTFGVREIGLDEIAAVIQTCRDVARQGDELVGALGLTTVSGTKLFGFQMIAFQLYKLATTPDQPADVWPARA
jgi:hypothetical protein